MNATDETEAPGPWNSPYPPVFQGIVWFVVLLVSLETIIGNAMVIIAYKTERAISKQVSNRYIVSLAISDLIIGIEGFPLFTVYVLNGERWPLGSIACETWLLLDYTLCLVSILTVLLITADRYLSVCHTAKYLKWQSPAKTQVLIILSWVLPLAIFSIMIYGWSAISGDETRLSEYECYAPFLSNPYVNMGMYVAYYWTTLVAMLILYKGIHQAAKNLEKKAKAKERRHIALLLSQRLGTQVGVGLMLHSTHEGEDDQMDARDSGYNTRAAEDYADGDRNLEVIHEVSEHRSNSLRIEADLPSDQIEDEIGCEKYEHQRLAVMESINDPDLSMEEHQGRKDNGSPEKGVSDSISLLFNDDSFSSILQFDDNEQNHDMDGLTHSDNSSVLLQRPLSTDFYDVAPELRELIPLIVGFFAILWSPYYVMATVYGFCKGECIPPLLYTLSYYMCYLNSSGNPFAYALANRQFRSAFIRMFRGNFNKVN
ncbi:hypothetical protein QR680_002068 [Steinernema hermaphroditum]|uniref:G-protein coupled receptors family 1 profile domain-containing protein n=1 Tax=Steinernema hermaphroditum TaxID=289476 RepID=A0AA39LGX3_9BILA|nr:hypothetical protein QR680_002068 [Steinernema hermaphroditum]